MEEPKSVIRQDFDRSGQYESGLKSLVKSLQWAFGLLLVVIVGMLIYFFTGGGYFSVEPQRAVIVMKFGKIEETFFTGGHWFLPYPVNQFIEIQTNPQTMTVDFMPTEAPAGQEQSSLEPGRDSYLFTGDANIVHSSWAFSYKVSDPRKYYTTAATPLKPVLNGIVVNDETETDADGFNGTRGPQTLIRNLFRQAVIHITASMKIEDMLREKQGFYKDEVMRHFVRLVNAADCGVEVVNVTLNRVAPPAKTKAAFDEVAAASNTQSTLKNKALEYQVQIENDSQAQKAAILAAAETYRKQIVSEVKSESIYFTSINKEYAANPKTVLMALYTSTLAEVMQNEEDKFILGSGSMGKGQKKLWIKLNPEPKKQKAVGPAAGEEK
jgi:regulator of protease activity HflC (stomatin/prohibitin superfamily)